MRASTDVKARATHTVQLYSREKSRVTPPKHERTNAYKALRCHGIAWDPCSKHSTIDCRDVERAGRRDAAGNEARGLRQLQKCRSGHTALRPTDLRVHGAIYELRLPCRDAECPPVPGQKDDHDGYRLCP